MGETISSETRTARKDYICEYCRARIANGGRHAVWKNADGGRIFTGRGHLWCVDCGVADEWEPDEIMDPDEFREACREQFPGVMYPWIASATPPAP
jgi:hypothetical protein